MMEVESKKDGQDAGVGDDQPKKHVCPLCPRSFNQYWNLVYHYTVHQKKKKKKKKRKKPEAAPNPEVPSDTNPKPSPKMSEINKAVITVAAAVSEKPVNVQQRKFQCPLCDKSFSQQRNLRAHAKVHEREGQPINLDQLQSQNVDAQESIKSQPVVGPPKRKCEVCGKSFRDIVVHMRTHTGDRPYKCDTCSKGFTCSTHLQRHKREVHGQSIFFRCCVCNSGFAKLYDLKEHSKMAEHPLPRRRIQNRVPDNQDKY